MPHLLITTGPLFFEESESRCGDTNQRTTIGKSSLHQSAIRRILPNRKPRARCAPRIHRFPVGAFFPSYPFHEIKDQVFDRSTIGHSCDDSLTITATSSTSDCWIVVPVAPEWRARAGYEAPPELTVCWSYSSARESLPVSRF